MDTLDSYIWKDKREKQINFFKNIISIMLQKLYGYV